MKQPKSSPNKRAPQPPHIIRRYETLSPEETDDVVESVADLIVNFVQKTGVGSEGKRPVVDGQSAEEPREPPASGKGKRRR
jgi:hypothetical protein